MDANGSIPHLEIFFYNIGSRKHLEEQQHLFPPLFSYLSYLIFPAQDDEHCWQSESGSGNCTLFCLASRTGHCMAATLHSLISGKPGTGPRMVIPFC